MLVDSEGKTCQSAASLLFMITPLPLSREYSRNMLMNDHHEKRSGRGQHEKRSTRKKNRKWSTRKKELEVVNTKKDPEVVTTKKKPEVVTTKKIRKCPVTFDL